MFDAASGCGIEVDSAGTHGYHIGGPADPRSIEAAQKRGIDMTSHRARQVSQSDFEEYDYIVVMDKKNYDHLQKDCPRGLHEKIHYFLDFAPQLGVKEVPDPYYGGATHFERVLDLVEQASDSLVAHLFARHKAA